jgi:osmotically-inducible protein OsmY
MSGMARDQTIAQQVTERIATRGIRSPCRIDVQAKNGEVILSGEIQHAYQRSAVLQVVSATSGVRHVVDRLRIKRAAKRE